MEMMPELTFGQYQLVYNMLSFAIASMFGSFAFFIMARQQLSPRFRPAMIMSALVVGIAGYHYFRIFNSWHEAYTLADGVYVASGAPFNDAYRYVDWLLTVPLLVAELIAVLALTRDKRNGLMARLVIASALMIATGYPGEITNDTTTRLIWGTISTIPFTYIVYALWVELDKAIDQKSERVGVLLRNTKLLLIGTWGFYPIAYLAPVLGIVGTSGSAEVALQVGYSIADVAAKCGYGVMIYHIARAKMEDAGESVAPVAQTAK